MQGEVQLIVTAGSTEYIDNGLWNISPTYFFGQTSWNINNATFFGNAVPSYSYFTIGTIIAMDPSIGGLVESCVVTSFDSLTGDITTDVGLDFTNLSPIPFIASARITTLVDTTTQNYLDLFENESISQNWKFQDLSNFTSQGAFSREFRIPYTENNQQALGALFDVNVSAGNANYFHYKLPAEIRVDTLPVATGYLRVRKVYRQLNRINEVELAFYAETPDFVRLLGEKKLADITDLTNLDEVVEYSNVTTSTATRIWTICDRGQLWSEGEQANTRSLLNPLLPVYPADLTPALSWWYLFEQIFIDAGFELVAGTLQSLMTEYYMPWCNSRYLSGSDTTGGFGFAASTTASTAVPGTGVVYIPYSSETFDNNGSYNPATYTFTAPAPGIYNFNFSFNLTIGAGGGARIFIQGISPGVNVLNLVDVNFNAGTQVWNYSTNIILNQGQTIRFAAYKQGTSTMTIETDSTIQLVSANLYYSQSIYYNLNAPDMRQIDFVTDVIKMHNCAIVPDRAVANKIYIIPQNSYLGSGNVVDWTSKLDTSKDITLSSLVDLQKAKFQFTYTAGSDVLSNTYKTVNRIYGDYEAVGYTVNPDTEPSDFAIGEQKIQLVTQSTPSGVVDGSGYVIPMFINDSLKFVAPGPRCLYYPQDYSIQLFNDGTLAAVATDVPTLNNYSVVYANLEDYDLNWAPEVPAHFINSNPYNNLFNLYWRGYMNALYSPDARMMEAYFALDLKDILTFSFADKIYIQDSYWRILEISDYKIGNYESTKVTLLKFVEDAEDCGSTPVSVSVNGEVNFENAAGDPVEPTQSCCIRYGYNWDEANAICWAITPTGTRPNPPVTGSTTNPAPRVLKTAPQTRNILNSTITGTDITIANTNIDMLAVGTKLELDAAVSGSNLLGKNTYTRLPGIHLGGGFKDADITNSIKGYAQHGVVILHRKDTYTSAGNAFLFVEGINNTHIDMPDETVWSCLLHLTVWDNTSNTNHTGQYSFKMSKVGGIAAVSAITTINAINGTAFTLTLGVNVAVTNLHRLYLTLAGGSYPVDIMATASIQYQQNTRI